MVSNGVTWFHLLKLIGGSHQTPSGRNLTKTFLVNLEARFCVNRTQVGHDGVSELVGHIEGAEQRLKLRPSQNV